VTTGGSGAGVSCGIADDTAQVTCWGTAAYGLSSPPSATFSMIDAGLGDFVCGITTDGEVECWGDDTYGQVSGAP
jgi:hypothetical protein